MRVKTDKIIFLLLNILCQNDTEAEIENKPQFVNYTLIKQSR